MPKLLNFKHKSTFLFTVNSIKYKQVKAECLDTLIQRKIVSLGNIFTKL
jgi:hypothetical protein